MYMHPMHELPKQPLVFICSFLKTMYTAELPGNLRNRTGMHDSKNKQVKVCNATCLSQISPSPQNPARCYNSRMPVSWNRGDFPRFRCDLCCSSISHALQRTIMNKHGRGDMECELNGSMYNFTLYSVLSGYSPAGSFNIQLPRTYKCSNSPFF